MEVTKLRTCFEFVRYSANTLGSEQLTIVENNLSILKTDNNFKEIFLWGTIYGAKQDYHIAFGYQNDILSGKTYYYSKDYLNWKKLKSVSMKAKNLTLHCTTAFQGDPELIIQPLKDNPLEFAEDLITKNSVDVQYKDTTNAELKEEDRLIAAVSLIDDEASIVPRAALYKKPNGDVIPNRSFKGLTSACGGQLKSYLHFRPPLLRWNKILLQRKDYNYAFDFLDAIDNDIPVNYSWSRVYEKGGALIILRPLYWPGMTFYHCINMPDYGFYYQGNGKKSLDITFMLEKM